MRNIKARYLWISVAVSFLIAVGLIFAVTQTSGVWTNVVIVLIAITFIYTTIAIQIASTKTFRYKAKKRQYQEKCYLVDITNIEEQLRQKGYQARTTSYGISYLKVNLPNAYKIVLIKDAEKYFNHEEEKNQSSNKNLEKCERFMGCELFLNYDLKTLEKLPDFSIQGTKIYYCGFYLLDDKLICPNYIEPHDQFKDLMEQIKTDLMLKEEDSTV